MRRILLFILLLSTIFIMSSCSLSYLASIPAKNKENENIDKLIQKEENYEFKSFLRTKNIKIFINMRSAI